MSSKRLVEKTLSFDSPDRIPRQTWILPWAEANYPDEVETLRSAYPDDIIFAPALYKTSPKTIGDKYAVGEYVDEWGCRFSNVHGGVIGVVRQPLLDDWDDLDRLQPPAETLSVDSDAVNAFCRSRDAFVLSAFPGQRPFERFQFIRTMERALIDLVTEPPGLPELLNLIHAHYCKEVEAWARTEVDGIMLMDDWGTQQGLIVSPDIFRRFFKPMYRDYADIAKRFGKSLFMHSDGNIAEILPDLIEVGVDALNSQLFCMDIESLGERFRGKITFWGEIDRQTILPRGSRQDIARAVHKVHDNLYCDGGVIAQCEFGLGARPENVLAVFETWDSIKVSEDS